MPEPAGLPAVYAMAEYGGAVRSALIAHKERGVLPLARPLGEALAAGVRRALGGSGPPRGRVLLVPVPSSRRSVAVRGHDPVWRMALAASRMLRREGLPTQAVRLLRQCRVVADQSGLDARARAANLRGALGVIEGAAPLLEGGEVLLVDDLMTTGASLVEAAGAVRAAGGRVTAAAVVAVPRRRTERPPHPRNSPSE